ncbi:unnamed protein product [Heligmosomoides polygyrus]|uniref:Uncharacterized protein n=1 Tax=Heligmosomoides polygyrus TaxID=6339 RepID=A0A183F3R2_HELPZ|nr:unnamed protein product [Heligmosomoides polygyrus]
MHNTVWFLKEEIIDMLTTVKTQLAYTLPDLEKKAAASYSAPSSSQENAPTGIFHYSDTDNAFQSKFKVPDFETLDPIRMASELMSAAATAENRRKIISGINLPLPFAGKPLGFQMTGESRSGLSFTENKKRDGDRVMGLSPEAQEAFQEAKRICLHSNADSCDEALDTFHRVKFGASIVDTIPIHQILDNDPTTAVAKMFVPSLEERMEDLEKEARLSSSWEGSSASKEHSDPIQLWRSPVYGRHRLIRDRHPFSNVRPPPNHARSRVRSIRNFLQRIS